MHGGSCVFNRVVMCVSASRSGVQHAVGSGTCMQQQLEPNMISLSAATHACEGAGAEMQHACEKGCKSEVDAIDQCLYRLSKPLAGMAALEEKL